MSAVSFNFGAAFLTGLAGILVSHLLGPQGRGVYATALVWGSVTSFIVQLGVNHAVVYLASSDESSIGRVLSGTLMIFSVQAAATLSIALLLVQHFTWYPVSTRDAIELYLFYVPCSLLLGYLTCICLASKSIRLFNVMKIVSALPPMIAVVVSLLVGATLIRLLTSLVAAGFSISLLSLFFVCRNSRFALKPIRETRTVHSLLSYGMRSYFANLSSIANSRIDQLFLSLAVPAAALGNYAVATSYSLLLYPLSASIANLGFAKVASVKLADQSAVIRGSLTKGTASLAAGLLALWYLRAYLIPRLYGKGFHDAVDLCSVLCLAALFFGLNSILGDSLRGLNRPGYVSKAETFSTIITLGGLYFAIPRYGVLGAAYVSLAAYITVTILLGFQMHRVLPVTSTGLATNEI